MKPTEKEQVEECYYKELIKLYVIALKTESIGYALEILDRIRKDGRCIEEA